MYRLVYIIIAFGLTACQTPGIPSPPGGGASIPGLPSPPSVPGGGGSPSAEPSSPSPQPPAGSTSSSENGDSDSTAIPDEWEDDSTGAEGSSADSGDPLFEESDGATDDDAANNDEVSFEEPEFEDDGGLSEEELEELEKELNESLGDFDEDIQRERTFAEERANENASDGELGGVGVFDTYEEGEDDGNVNKSKQAATGSQSSSGQGGSSQSSDGQGGASGEAKADNKNRSEGVGNESEDVVIDESKDVPEVDLNDDIVARQIREAAEKETDPELKEKLWEEYRNYKRQ